MFSSYNILLLGVLFCTGNAYASGGKNSEKDLTSMEEKSKKLSISPQSIKTEEQQSNELLNKIKSIPKKSSEKQTNIKDSIAFVSYRNDKYWINGEGKLVLLESK